MLGGDGSRSGREKSRHILFRRLVHVPQQALGSGLSSHSQGFKDSYTARCCGAAYPRSNHAANVDILVGPGECRFRGLWRAPMVFFR